MRLRRILDADQIMDDLIPISFPEENVFIGDAGYMTQSDDYTQLPRALARGE